MRQLGAVYCGYVILKLLVCDSLAPILTLLRKARATGTERGIRYGSSLRVEAVDLPRLDLDGVVEPNGACRAGADGDGLSVLYVARQSTRL